MRVTMSPCKRYTGPSINNNNLSEFVKFRVWSWVKFDFSLQWSWKVLVGYFTWKISCWLKKRFLNSINNFFLNLTNMSWTATWTGIKLNTDLTWQSIKEQIVADNIASKSYLFCYNKHKNLWTKKATYSLPALQ